MSPAERASVCLRLKEAQTHIGDLFEALTCECRPSAMLHDAHALADLAGEIESTLKQLAVPPVLQFHGADVVLGDLPNRTAAEDKAAQRYLASAPE